MITTILKFAILPLVAFLSGAQINTIVSEPVPENLGAVIPTPVASFTTSLATGISSTDTTMSLVSITTSDGVTLTDGGTYGFTIDEGTASKEYVIGTVETSDNTVISMTRGVSVITGNTSIAALKKAHRRGASVKITDHPVLPVIARILNGDESLPNTLTYATTTTFTDNLDLITKEYVDGVAIAGAPDASTVTKGITRLSTAPVSASAPISVGDNDTRVPSQDENNALAGTSGTPSATNLYVTANDNARNYGSIQYASSTAGSDTYVITLSPALAAYATGTQVSFRADVANTGAATLNVNALGAKDLVVGTATPLVTGNILASQIVNAIYNGTAFTVLNPQTVLPTFASSTVSVSTSTTGTTDDDVGVVTLVLGKTSRVLLNCECNDYMGTGNVQNKATTYSFNVNNDTYIWGSVTRQEGASALVGGFPIPMQYITPELPPGTYTFRMRMVLSSVSNYSMQINGELQAIALTQ